MRSFQKKNHFTHFFPSVFCLIFFICIHCSTIVQANDRDRNERSILAIELIQEDPHKGLIALWPDIILKDRKALTVFAVISLFYEVPELSMVAELKEDEEIGSFSTIEIFFLNGTRKIDDIFPSEDEREIILGIYENLDHVYKDDPFLSKCISKHMELFSCYEEGVLAGKLKSIDYYLDAIDKSKTLEEK